MKSKPLIIYRNPGDPLVVELDSAAMAAYVRLSDRKVARTEILPFSATMTAVDYDESGEAVGIEFLEVREFTLSRMLKTASIELLPPRPDSEVRYLRAGAPVEV